MPYSEVSNLLTVTKTNMIDEMPCFYGIWRTTGMRMPHHVCCRAVQRSQLLSKSLTDLHRGLSCSNIWLSYKWNLIASWMPLHNSRWFQEYLRMLLHSLRALCLAPGRPGSIWKYLEALVRLSGVSGRFVCGFWTELHVADVRMGT